MNFRWLIISVLIITFFIGVMYLFKNAIVSEILSAQDQSQVMQEVKINPNITTASKALVPKDYGKLVGIESVGKATMLWFEATDGKIRRVQISFWEDEIILDDKVLVIERD